MSLSQIYRYWDSNSENGYIKGLNNESEAEFWLSFWLWVTETQVSTKSPGSPRGDLKLILVLISSQTQVCAELTVSIMLFLFPSQTRKFIALHQERGFILKNNLTVIFFIKVKSIKAHYREHSCHSLPKNKHSGKCT